MIFRLRTCGFDYDAQQRARLETLGFTFAQQEWLGEIQTIKAIDEVPVDFVTLEDLVHFLDAWGDLILTKCVDTGNYIVKIYDYYNE